ncbi:PREDICTED: epidermal growth factor receptor kinase substrate 8-like protein 3 [Myotis brandtii]|uniref:epidermal growth factor receptor kinase substrate 8-like protein 3 n=1 Tax=Myotis brandtii TaxID=109478 RepID=UPI0007045486|nr:PREDICTED: epidermal growth factor receptor kinase substrate 8-like protein 3 [Myotis brandtii]
MSRPSSKAIYMHRKEYLHSLASEPACPQHRVEHLMTCKLGTQGVRQPKDAVQRLQELDAQGRVWSQNLLLQIRDGWLQLLDIETKEELDSYRLDSIQAMDAVLNSCSYNSVLSITVQGAGPPGGSTLLFQCPEVGAERLRTSLQKALKEELELRPRFGVPHPGQDRWRGAPLERPLPREQAAPLEWGPPPEQPPWMAPEHSMPPSPRPLSRHSSAREPSAFALPPPRRPPTPEDPVRDEEVLNHILRDIEVFVQPLMKAQVNASAKKTKKQGKKKNTGPGGRTPAQYVDCFQKFKYSFNLLGRLAIHLQNPSAAELLHMLFRTLHLVLTQCPERDLAGQVISPLLTPEAVDMLKFYLSPPDSNLWKSLGPAWTTSRDNWTGHEVPPYQPTFYDGWQPPEPSNQAPSGYQDSASLRGLPARVLDHSKRWWLVRDQTGDSGYIPSNILEPLQSGPPGRQSPALRAPMLRLSSRPEEVRAWLQAENFTPGTVKTLGALTGSQLLYLSPGELQMVCPQDAPRVVARLEASRRTLGISP